MNEIEIEDLIRRATTGEYFVHGNIADADCVVGFSFGFRKVEADIKPGLSNEDLAKFIRENASALPKILQFEIADALGDTSAKRIEKHRTPDAYLNTREVAEQALVFMTDNGWSNALLVAHPFHMPRVDALCQKLGMQTIVPAGLNFVRFDSESEQSWTQSQETWAKEEPNSIRRNLAAGRL